MSFVGNAFRNFAEECDNVPQITGAVFIISGDIIINLACADQKLSSYETVKVLLQASVNAINNDGGKRNFELSGILEDILGT